MPLAILAHVDNVEGLLRVKEEFGQLLCQLCLADTSSVVAKGDRANVV